MREIENFLTDSECNQLIELINQNHSPSSVVVGGTDISTIDVNSRTSSTCNLDPNNILVKTVHNKIAEYLGLDKSLGESLQGQLYEVGQYFKPHYDFFSGEAYNKHCLHSGNRTHTLMIYLNDDFEGGGTNFPNLGFTINPKRGKAVTWQNMINGETQQNSLHEGVSVTSGKKYIITSWWREKAWNNAEDTAAYINKPKVYTDVSQIPKLTQLGFEVRKVPNEAWGIIKDSYEILKDKVTEENFVGKENFIPGKTELLSYDHLPSIRSIIHQKLFDIHKDFAKGADIEPSFIYGIRSYLKGATLASHRDRVETHHISSIIIVDKDLKCGCQNREFGDDWALDIQGHDGEWYKVYAQPGDMILYESAVCEHARLEPFQGTYFRNFFVHYKLV